MCGKVFEAARRDTCGETCRKRAGRLRPVAAVAESDVPEESQVAAAVRVELEALGVVETVEGARALALARRVDSPREGGSAASSADRQLAEVLERVRARAVGVDRVARLEARAATKLALVRGYADEDEKEAQ